MDLVCRRAALAISTMVLVLTTSCGVLGGNQTEICEDTMQAFQDFNQKMRMIPPTDSAAWNQQANNLSARLSALATKADDAELKDALRDMAAAWNKVDIGSGDMTQFQTLITDHPRRLGRACS